VTRVRLLAGAAALAAVIVVAAILISQSGGDDGSSSAPAPQVERLPQHGVHLGDPKAPATMIEFADLQCPFCRDYAVRTLPGVIDRYVKTGRVRLELRLLAFLGPDSEKGRQVANAATLQDKLWDFTQLFYENQGQENSGYVTDSFLRRLERKAGLDMNQLAADVGSAEAQAFSRRAERMANQLGVSGTPSFYLVKGGGQPQQIDVAKLGEALGGQ
jgi:protein-disulfide isomerase